MTSLFGAIFGNIRGAVSKLLRDRSGNIAITFGLAVVPIVVAAGGAIDYSRASSARANMQSALDSTALALVKTASTVSQDALTTSATSYFNAVYSQPGVSNIAISAAYDSSSSILTLNASAKSQTAIMQVAGMQNMTIAATSKATLAGQLWPVCVMITNPSTNHTLLVQNKSSIDFSNCLVQVNTQNWDAVEARDTSYIHSANGVNCFVGDIHYGDVTPAKAPTCALMADPYASITVPQNSCDHTNMQVSTNTTLSPGTYCGGLKITNSANVTFSTGNYFIQNGDFTIQNSANVTGTGVSFLLSGTSSNINITTTGTLNLSASTSGAWAGFLFFWDQTTTSKGQTDIIQAATANLSGILYFAGQTLSIKGGAKVTVSPGALIADMLLPDNGHLTLNGSTSASYNLTKAMDATSPRLVQ
jgi:Flp pilus assembly protein TadG